VNLDEFASSLQHSPIFVNLSDTPNAFVAHTSQLSTTTPIALGSIGVKCKQSNMFSLVINATNKNTKVVMEVMDRINLMQLEIEECCMKINEHTIKD
jgi:hypothetical protein